MIPVLARGDGGPRVEENHRYFLQLQFLAVGHFECFFGLD